MLRNHNKRRCRKPSCRAWAVHDGKYCHAHHSLETSFYGTHFSDRESELLARLSEDGLENSLLLRLSDALLRGVDGVVKLLQARSVLSSEAALAFDKILDGLNEISGWEKKL
jgi:hypothetical protein